MRKSTILAAILMIAAALILAITSPAQTYKVGKDGKITETVKKDSVKIKKQDKVYQVVNGKTFYQGAKGGIYSIEVSKKTGKEYHKYIK